MVKAMNRRQIKAIVNDADCLLSKTVMMAICELLVSKGRICNMLVFGLGGDSKVWQAVNRGYTLFVEDNPKWIERITSTEPDLNVMHCTFDSTSNPELPIHEQPAIDREYLEGHPPPEQLYRRIWDVILVDGPIGSYVGSPGRSLSIHWAASLSSASCDIFVDDYSRPIEFIHTNTFLFHRYRRFQIFGNNLKTLWLKSPDPATKA